MVPEFGTIVRLSGQLSRMSCLPAEVPGASSLLSLSQQANAGSVSCKQSRRAWYHTLLRSSLIERLAVSPEFRHLPRTLLGSLCVSVCAKSL